MSLHISINSEKELLNVRGVGEIVTADVNGYYSRLKAQADIGTCSKALIDLQAPDISFKKLSVKSIRDMGMTFRISPLLPQGTRMAIVVRSTLAYGFVRLFMASRGDQHLLILPFKKMDEALAWLEIERADIAGIETQAN